jgi:signal peptidase I
MLYHPNTLEVVQKKPFRHKVMDEWIKPMILALAVVMVVNLFFPRYAVLGHSMEPGLHENDRLFVSNVDAMTQSVTRGQVVILTAPGDNETVVKRVIGLPGETVEVYGGVVYVDGVPLEENYIRERTRFSGRWVVGANQYFVLGDNRNASRDSQDYGPVDASRISGVVKFRFWPLNALQAFERPAY